MHLTLICWGAPMGQGQCSTTHRLHTSNPPAHNEDILKAILVLVIVVMSNPLSAKQICRANFFLLHTQNRTLGNSAKIEVPSLCSELNKSNWPVNERSFSSDFHLRKKVAAETTMHRKKKMKKIFFHESKSSYGRKKYFPSLVAI